MINYFNWKELFHLAEELSQSDNEAHIRSAISRYYYSVFCSARFYLVEIKNEYSFLKRGGIHTKVYEYLKKIL